MLVHKER